MVGTAAAASSNTVHEWDRFDRMWGALFHVALGVPTVVALVDSGFDPVRGIGLLAAVAVVVIARQVAARSLVGVGEGSRRHLVIGLLWAAATAAAMVFLVNAEGAFFFALYGLFPQAFMMLPRTWAIVFDAAIVPAVLVGAEGISALGDSGFVVTIVGSALLAPAIGLFFHAITRQSTERQQAILALQAAQDEAESLLQASLALSRARDPQEVVAAVGACLADHGVKMLALRTGVERLAVWAVPGYDATSETDRSSANVTTVKVVGPGPGPDMEVSLEASGPKVLGATSRRTLETLATSCGLALANFRLVEQAREAGVSEERARLAREIHDTLAQGFVSVLTQLEAASEPLARSPEAVVERVERASRIARASLGEARRSMHALRPVVLEAAPLPEAIERVVARWSDDAMVPAQVTTSGHALSLSPAIEVTLLRATQEALANVARHAQATSVSVTLSFLGDSVVLDVHDDGRGFDPGAPATGSGGFGLEALRQRVDVSGGFFGLESEPGRGTTVTVHIPVIDAEGS